MALLVRPLVRRWFVSPRASPVVCEWADGCREGGRERAALQLFLLLLLSSPSILPFLPVFSVELILARRVEESVRPRPSMNSVGRGRKKGGTEEGDRVGIFGSGAVQ